MTKRELLKAIQESRAELESALAGLTSEQMAAPGVMGDWSVKDILGHIAMWESWLVTVLYTAERDAIPKMFRTQAEVDKVNAESVAEQRDRPLDRVLSDFHTVHVQVLSRLENLPERDLIDPRRFKWLDGKPLEEIVVNNTFEHYAEHRPAIEARRAQHPDLKCLPQG